MPFPPPPNRRPPSRHGLAPAVRDGFTLIEILLAMALFAIGFAMMAIIPASAMVMQARYEQVVEAEIASTNALAFVSARKAFWPAYENWYTHYHGTYTSETESTVIRGAHADQMGSAWDPAAKKGLYKGLFWYVQPGPPQMNVMGETRTANDAAGNTVANGMLAPLVCKASITQGGPTNGTGNSLAYAGGVTYGWPGTSGRPDRLFDCEDTLVNCSDNMSPWSGFRGAWEGGSYDNLSGDGLPSQIPQLLRLYDTCNSGATKYPSSNPAAFGGGPTVDGYPYLFADSVSSGLWLRRQWLCNFGSCTDFARGRIHACHNRLMPDAVFPLEIRSYPSSIPLSQRRQYTTLCYVDQNVSTPDNRNWAVYAVSLAKNTPTDTWLESPTATPYVLGTNTNSTIPNPLTKGDIGRPMQANPLGMKDKGAQAVHFTLSGTAQRNGSPPISPWEPPLYNHGHPFLNYVDSLWGVGRIDDMLNQGIVTPLSGTAVETQYYPPLMKVPAIIYDWDNSLIQVAYPKEYVPVNGQSDRRLKVGDHLVTLQQGLVLSVKSVLPETRSQYAVTDQPYYQVLEVYPSLRDSMLGGPATNNPAVGNASPTDPGGAGGNAYPYWRLSHIYMAPAAQGRSNSPWSSLNVLAGDSFMSANLNQ